MTEGLALPGCAWRDQCEHRETNSENNQTRPPSHRCSPLTYESRTLTLTSIENPSRTERWSTGGIRTAEAEERSCRHVAPPQSEAPPGAQERSWIGRGGFSERRE